MSSSEKKFTINNRGQWFYTLVVLSMLIMQGCSSLGMKNIAPAELEAKYANTESKYVEINGTRVHYRDEGQGEPLVLLHGILASLHTWDGWTEKLKSQYRIIRLDIPPFGLTGQPAFSYTTENYMKFLNSFTEALGIKKYNLAGSSLGGYFAWNMALAYPDKVERLILLDPAAYPQDPPFPVKVFTLPVIGKISTWITPRFIVANNVRATYGEPEKVTDEIIDQYHELILREGNREAIREFFLFVQRMNGRMPLEIAEIKQPTLLMWGGRDDWVSTEEMTANWKRDLPSAKLIIYDKAGHIPMEEIPAETAVDAADFLSGKTGRASAGIASGR